MGAYSSAAPGLPLRWGGGGGWDQVGCRLLQPLSRCERAFFHSPPGKFPVPRWRLDHRQAGGRVRVYHQPGEGLPESPWRAESTC